MFYFERTFNRALIKLILCHPAIYPRIGDDTAPRAEEFEPNLDSRMWYVVVRNEQRAIVGLFLFIPQSVVCWEAHVSLLPSSWGPIGKEAGRAVIPWFFERTRAQRLVASIPVTNPLAIRYAEACGLQRFGVNERSFMKCGRLVDQVCLGLSA